MRWLEPLYIGEKVMPGDVKGMKEEADSGDMKEYGNCFAIILALNPANLMEILSFHQLTIPYYREIDLSIIGIAKDREDAVDIVKKIIEDMNVAEKGVAFKQMFH